MVDNRVLRQNKNMNNENDLEKVYVVGQMPGDQTSDCSDGSDSDQDQRRRTLPFSDEASNSTDLRRVMDPFNSESGVTSTEESTVTPASNNVHSRSGNSNTGTILKWCQFQNSEVIRKYTSGKEDYQGFQDLQLQWFTS